MKKIVLLLAVVLMSGIAMAQGQGRGGQNGNTDPKARAEQMTERMTKDLSLTDAQKQKVLELNLAQAEQFAANRPEKPADKADRNSAEAKEAREKMRQEREAAATAYDAKLKAILTPEQYAKYTEQKSKRDKANPDGERGKKGNGKNKNK